MVRCWWFCDAFTVKYSAIIELTGKEEDEEEKKIIANHHQV